MCKFFLVSVIFMLSIFDNIFGNREIDEGGVHCKARGRSGKISIGFQQNVDSDPNRITIDFDELKERDMSGNEVGKTGREKHSFNSFASQDFQFTEPRDDTLQNISVRTFQFQATLVESAQLKVDVYIFRENGTIEIDDEETNVTRGNVKFSISLENWKFCGTGSGDVSCRKGNADETGSYLDFVITIKGKGTLTPKNDTDMDEGPRGKKRGEQYELGGDSEVVLSNKVKYDNGNWTDMTSGYPKVETRGSKTSFVFRFDKFSQSVFYDPTIYAEQSESGDTGTTANPTDGSSCLHVRSSLCFLLMLFLSIFASYNLC